MSDDNKDEALDNSKKTPDKNIASEIIPTVPAKENSSGKNWKEYFLEFVMLFLAVSLSFFAENIRENESEKAKEIEYIISMIEDVETDKANLKKAISSNDARVKHLDSLASLAINYAPSLNKDAQMYTHYGYALIHPNFISPTERTMQQLKNAGGMRLLRKKRAIHAIIEYDANAKELANQQMYYERYQNSSIDLGVQIFNFEKLVETLPLKGKNIGKPKDYFKLINTEKIKLIEFGNIITTYGGVAFYYGHLLQQMNVQADHLILTLKKEYNIK